MTFYEAALRVLEAAGRPLHFQEITERSIQQNLLSHVGKLPELTMLSRLLAMARRKTDRKVVVTSKDTFALAEWALPEEPDALAQTALSETREEENLPPLRPAERHPEPRSENVRVAGRGAERKRRRDEEDDEGRRRKRRFPPVAEVAFEILSESGAMRAQALAERAKERELAGELTEAEILTALLEDNQRRIDNGRRPKFVLDRGSGELSLEAPEAATPPADVQAAFASVLGIPMEAGRPVLARPAAAEPSPELEQAHAQLKAAAKEARRAAARALRKRLAELDAGTFERTMVKVLHALGFRELKVARRSKEGPLLISRRRDGSLELRYAIRIARGQPTVDRKAVQEMRRDLSHHSAQVGLIATPGDLRGEARAEATAGALVFLWCGEGLAEKYLEAGAGVQVTRVEAYEIDERFFESARVDAQEAQRRREERVRDRHRGERPAPEERAGRRADEPSEPREDRGERRAERAAPSEGEGETERPAVAGVPGAGEPLEPRVAAPPEELDEEADEEGDDEGEDETAAPGSAPADAAPGTPPAPGDPRRRRRRRRRGRRGRGRPEGAPGAPGMTAPAAGAAEPAAIAGPPPPSGEAAPEPAPRPPGGASGEGSAP